MNYWIKSMITFVIDNILDLIETITMRIEGKKHGF